MKTQYPMIPFPLIVKATDGDTEAINYFDLWEFINYINSQYGMIITTRYQDEKEILFNLKKGTDWYEIIKINSDEL